MMAHSKTDSKTHQASTWPSLLTLQDQRLLSLVRASVATTGLTSCRSGDDASELWKLFLYRCCRKVVSSRRFNQT